MSEQAWTKGPWYVSQYGDNLQLESENGAFVLWNKADYARIEECVNAMDGFVRVESEDDEGDGTVYRWSKVHPCIPNPAEFVRAARELAEAVNSVLSNSGRFFAEQYVCGCGWCDENCKTPHTRATEALSAFRAAGGEQ